MSPYHGPIGRLTHVSTGTVSGHPSHCHNPLSITCLVSHLTPGKWTNGLTGYLADTVVATGITPGTVIMSGTGAA